MHLSAQKVSGHWWFLLRGNLHMTPQTNMSIYVADSACDVARCQLSNQLSEPALSANPAVHLQGDPALSGPSTQTYVCATVKTTLLLSRDCAHMIVSAMLHLDMNGFAFETLTNGNANTSLEMTSFVMELCCVMHVTIAAFHGCCQASPSCSALHNPAAFSTLNLLFSTVFCDTLSVTAGGEFQCRGDFGV